MNTQTKITTLIAVLAFSVFLQGCAKSTSSTAAATGYPAITVQCGDQSCVK